MSGAEARHPFWAECRTCEHQWVLLHLPMEMEAAARIMKRAICPCRDGGSITIARQTADGKLIEPKARATV